MQVSSIQSKYNEMLHEMVIECDSLIDIGYSTIDGFLWEVCEVQWTILITDSDIVIGIVIEPNIMIPHWEYEWNQPPIGLEFSFKQTEE